MDSIHQARLAQSVEHQTLNQRVVGSSPTVDKKGPRSSLCTQVPCLAVKKWNRSIITESNIFHKCIIPIIRKEYA